MLKKRYIPLLTSSYNRVSGHNSAAQKLSNMFLEEVPAMGSGTKYIAYSCPGIETWITLGTSPVRGMFVHKELLYVVAGNTVYKVATDGTATSLGTMTTNSGKVSIAAINDYLVFCDGVSANPWSYRVSTATYAEITDADLPGVVSRVLGFGEYILFLIKDTQTVYVSDLTVATAVTATSFFAAESFYDNIISGAVASNLLYLFGTNTTEVFYNSGAQIVPFDRVSNGAINYGIVGANAVCVANNQVYNLARDANGIVGLMTWTGTQPNLIPNRSLNEKLKDYTQIDNCYMWVDNHNGHQFVNITFPRKTPWESATHTYDITTGAWFERSTFNPNKSPTAGYEGHPAIDCVYFNGEQYCGDEASGKIFRISLDIYDDNGYEMLRTIITPNIVSNDMFLSVYNVEIDVEGGLGQATGQGEDPGIILFYSNDMSNTWNGGWEVKVGRTGEYMKRVRYGSLGGGRTVSIKLEMTDPVPWVIHGITAEVDVEYRLSEQPQ